MLCIQYSFICNCTTEECVSATSATKHGAHINDTVVTRDVTGPILLENYGLLKRFVDI